MVYHDYISEYPMEQHQENHYNNNYNHKHVQIMFYIQSFQSFGFYIYLSLLFFSASKESPQS